jgi:hypothetical protein
MLNTHPLVSYARFIQKGQQKIYGLFSKITACIEISGGKVCFRPSVDVLKIVNGDKRLIKQIDRFMELLNDFYHKTDFRKFYDAHLGLYAVISERFNEQLVKNVNAKWVRTFFNDDIGNPIITISPSNGPYNYCISDLPDSENDRFLIIGSVRLDDEGLPVFNGSDYFVLMHELIHDLSNHRINALWEHFNSSATGIWFFVQNDMRKIGYHESQSMIQEWFTNLCVLMYLKEQQTTDDYENLIMQLSNTGWIWIDRSVAFMEHFYADRNRYPTIDEFMPQLVSFMNFTADHFGEVQKEHEARKPYITEIYPASGSTISTDSENVITLRFSVPMQNAWGVGLLMEDGQIRSVLNIAKDASWKDDKTFVITLDNAKLEKGIEYKITFMQMMFVSKTINAIPEDFTYTFNTAE